MTALLCLAIGFLGSLIGGAALIAGLWFCDVRARRWGR